MTSNKTINIILNMGKLDKVALQAIDERCVKTQAYLDVALHYLDVIEVSDKTRELSLVRIKVNEAKLWLGQYNEKIMDKLNGDNNGAGGE